MWTAAIAHAGTRVMGLDGVVGQQENHKKSGFALAYANVRCGGTVAASAPTGKCHTAIRGPTGGGRHHGVSGAALGAPARLDQLARTDI
jgi:hypothetical protein